MSITENSLYEAFGLKAPEQEPAAPADPTPVQPVQEGANEPDPAAQAQDGDEPAPTTEPTPQGAESGQDGPEELEGPSTGEDGKPALSEQQRRENAARRRKAEEQARIDAAVEQAVKAERGRAEADMAAFFAKAQLKNTLTGEPITTMEQFNAWNEAYTADKLSRELAAGKLTPESLHKAIEDSPVVKKAQEIIRNSEQEAQRRQQEQAKARIDADLLEIQKYDPAIKEVKDLLTMPNFPQFRDYVINKGLSYKDAYFLVNRESMAAAQAQAARQQAASNARSKDHLNAISIQGDGGVTVPPEELRMIRAWMPNATEAQIQAFYNKNKR